MALFGKNNHHSVLDDTSTFYTAQEAKTEKQKWADMNALQRLRYFKDYYLIKSLILIFAVSLTGILLYSCLKPRKAKLLFIAVVENTLIPEGKEQLNRQLDKLLITDNTYQEVLIDDTFPMGYETEAKLTAYIASKEIDLIVTNEERFKQLAEAGCFLNLDQFYPELAAEHPDLLYYADNNTENSTENSTIIDTIDKTIEPEAYGIRITNCPDFKNAWPDHSEAIIGVLINSPNKENAKLALEELLS